MAATIWISLGEGLAASTTSIRLQYRGELRPNVDTRQFPAAMLSDVEIRCQQRKGGFAHVRNKIHDVYCYLRVRDAASAIAFYEKAFGASEKFRLVEPEGRIGHAELHFGSAIVMVSDEYPEYGIQGPDAFGGNGSGIHLHVDDVDALTEQARSAGAEVTMEPTDQFYGERASRIRCPFGHEWLLGSQIEEVTPDEMQRRFSAMFEGDS